MTPRTGSRALEEFLLKAGGTLVGDHHTEPWRVPHGGKPNYTIAREPISHLESWYNHFRKNMTMLNFLRFHDNGWNLRPLNFYMGAVERVYIYELGLEHALRRMGFTVDEPLPHIGLSHSRYVMSAEEQKQARITFASDFEYYAHWSRLYDKAQEDNADETPR